MKSLLRGIEAADDIDLNIVPHGMHLLAEYGNSIDEIRADGFPISAQIRTAESSGQTKIEEYTQTIDLVGQHLHEIRPDAVMLVGDRLESLAAAMAASLLKIPIIHLGGGHITRGAVDNAYRYSISLLSDLHLATTVFAFERLQTVPTITRDSVFLVGSPTVDAIKDFIENQKYLREDYSFLPEKYALVTFHPTTKKNEPIARILEASINKILEYGYHVVITAPNNDVGSRDILNVIHTFSGNPHVMYHEHLGAERYYAALYFCTFVLGNSSSGIIEAPYFNKPVLNIGDREDGRDKDEAIIDVAADVDEVLAAIDRGFQEGWSPARCNSLYGDGNSVKNSIMAIKTWLSHKR